MNKIRKYVRQYAKEYIVLTTILIVLCLILFRKYFFFGEYYFFQGTDSVRTTFPTYYLFAKYINEGWSWWSFHMGIGASQLSRFTALSDPFNYLLYFNKDNIQKVIILVVSLRIIMAGEFFYTYLDSFQFQKEAKLLGSISYAFCGYIIVMGQNYGFATVCVYLPLLFLGIEKGIKNKKYNLFIILVFLTSVYFNTLFFICVILAIIYFLIRFVIEYGFKIKKMIVTSLTFMFSGILGVGLGAAWTIPVTYITGQSPRIAAEKTQNFFASFNASSLMTMFARMFSNDALGTSVDGNQYFGYANQYMQLSTYTTIFALFMFILIISNSSTKKVITLVVSTICIFFVFYWNGFSYILNACSTITYRWSFAFNFILGLVLTYGLDMFLRNTNVNLLKMMFLMGVLLQTYIYIIYIMVSGENELYSFINQNKISFYLPFFMVLIYIFISYCLKNGCITKKICTCFFLVGMCLEIIFNYDSFISKQQSYGKLSEVQDIEYFDDSMNFIKQVQQKDTSFYRIEKLFDSLYRSDGLPSDNDAMVQNYYGLKNYSSLNPVGYVKFLQNMGIYVMCPLETVDQETTKPEDIKSASLNYINGVGDRYDLMSYLGVKYLFVNTEREHIAIPENYELNSTYKNYECYINVNYNPLVFMTYQSVLNDQFKNLSVNDKDLLIFTTTIINDKSDEFLEDVDNVLEQTNDINKIMKNNRENFTMDIFKEDYLKGQIIAEDDGYLNTTIPYDLGWKIYIDGKRVNSLQVNNGLLGCKLQKGKHEIELKYFPYGMKVGMVISFICLALIFAINYIRKIKNNTKDLLKDKKVA